MTRFDFSSLCSRVSVCFLLSLVMLLEPDACSRPVNLDDPDACALGAYLVAERGGS